MWIRNPKQVLIVTVKASSGRYAGARGLPKKMKSILLLISLKNEHCSNRCSLSPDSKWHLIYPSQHLQCEFKIFQSRELFSTKFSKIQRLTRVVPIDGQLFTILNLNLKHSFSSARSKFSESNCLIIRHNPIVVFLQFRVHHRIHPLLAVTVSWRIQF